MRSVTLVILRQPHRLPRALGLPRAPPPASLSAQEAKKQALPDMRHGKIWGASVAPDPLYWGRSLKKSEEAGRDFFLFFEGIPAVLICFLGLKEGQRKGAKAKKNTPPSLMPGSGGGSRLFLLSVLSPSHTGS